MEILIYIGAVLAVLGLLGLGYCMKSALNIRKEPDEEIAATRLQGLVAWNLGAIALSALGLCMIVVGIAL